MKEFKYQTILLDPKDAIENNKELNHQGMRGWELVSTYPRGHNSNTVFFVFNFNEGSTNVEVKNKDAGVSKILIEYNLLNALCNKYPPYSI
jgi:hypothetical protein